MWDLYAIHDSGIAIQSTVERLCESLSVPLAPARRYGPLRRLFDGVRILTGTVEPVMTKRKSFQHDGNFAPSFTRCRKYANALGSPRTCPAPMCQLISPG